MFFCFYYNILNILFLCNSYSNKYSITFSNPKTQSLVGILELHDHLMFFILLIFNIKMCFFLYSIITSRKNLFFNEKKGPLKNDVFEFNERYVEEGVYSFKHATVLEFIWTILPSIVLVIMAVPSFMLLYSLEESNFPVFNICVIGNQ
jgi:heme/copper-type cytochrome/quinol oxidase subunit 2